MTMNTIVLFEDISWLHGGGERVIATFIVKPGDETDAACAAWRTLNDNGLKCSLRFERDEAGVRV